jgi:phosphoribosyl-dephospho-CoA transferase
MPDAAFRRHDLVWLDPAWPLEGVAMQPADDGALRGWVEHRLPLVVGRQDGQGASDDGLRLGFTLPGTGPRRRIGVRAPRRAVVDHIPAPLLEHMLAQAHAPAIWRTRTAGLTRDLGRSWLVAQAFGSLVTQAYTGELCIHAESDIDMLIQCRDRDDIDAALAALRRHAGGSPRLDAELRMPHGGAVAWRELDQALLGGGTTRVLVKSDTGVRLLRVAQFLSADFCTGAINDSCLSHAASPAA